MKSRHVKKILVILLTVMLLLGGLTGCKNKGSQDDDAYCGFNLKLGAGGKKENGEKYVGEAGTKLTGSYNGYLGYGYDVINSPYYDVKFKKLCVFDMDKMVSKGMVYEDNVGQSKFDTKTIVGETIYEYMSNLSMSVGVNTKTGLFSGSLESDFNMSDSISKEKSFAKSKSTITKKEQHLASCIALSDLRDFMYDNFKNDLNNPQYSPKMLLKRYGTHIMLQVFLGARLDMSYVMENKKRENTESLKTKVEASYGVVSGSASSEISTKARELLNTSSYIYKSWGGSTNYDMSNFDNAKSNYTGWLSSINNDSITLIDCGDISDNSKMLPIWELIDISNCDLSAVNNANDDNQRDAAVKAAREKYLNYNRYWSIIDEFNAQLAAAESSLGNMQDGDEYIKDIYIGIGDSSDKAMSDLLAKSSDLNIIGVDLNCCAGGLWVYMGYTKTTDKKQALTDLKLTDSYNEPCQQTWNTIVYTKITSHNLNYDAGGNEIYLYTAKDPKAGNPIKNLFVERRYDAAEYIGGQKGWTRVKHPSGYDIDLNKGAGGCDLFLWMQK